MIFRRTYIGSMPGRILNALKTVGVTNPVILLDEVELIGKVAHEARRPTQPSFSRFL